MPGASNLKIQLWDNDLLNTDDLIGETIIDVEERFYDERWRSLPNRPIETRLLKPPISSTATGSMRLWIDIENVNGMKTRNLNPPWDISPLPPQDLELRIVIWEVKDVPNDDPEDMSDIYIQATLPKFKNITQQTDTHIRACDGKVSSIFNLYFL